MTEPTDAEIVAVMRDGYNCRYNDEQDHIDFARAVLAKWGKPPTVAGEPVAEQGELSAFKEWLRTRPDKVGEELAQYLWSQSSERSDWLATTPQPTQAGAVPLTVSEIRKWWESENDLKDCEMRKITDFLRVVRAVEEKHGIKGGQHGDE